MLCKQDINTAVPEANYKL